MALTTFVATVVISSFLFIGAQETNDCTDPRGRLAWKALQSTDKGHMLYTNFNASVIVCTYVTKNSEDSSTMSVHANFIYQINDLPVVYNDPVTTKVENCEGLIAVYNETSGEKVSQSVILYSNFETCTIFFNIEQQECQLWAYENPTNDVIQECLETYKTFCEGEIYEVYNATCLT
uniref:Putative salivary lipocalin n=1 Tax=Ixodes scapularis TaxID=6945 RepID=A0A4D5RU79_IXOSC